MIIVMVQTDKTHTQNKSVTAAFSSNLPHFNNKQALELLACVTIRYLLSHKV